MNTQYILITRDEHEKEQYGLFKRSPFVFISGYKNWYGTAKPLHYYQKFSFYTIEFYETYEEAITAICFNLL